jgi:ABC-type transport system substrate-binding protein
MSRKLIAGLVAMAALGAAAFAATSALSTGAGARPAYATVSIDLSEGQPSASRAKAQAGGEAKKTKKPKVTYLQSSAPTTINPADVAAGGVGPYIDVKLTGCSKVIDGGVVASRLDVYVQGSYVKSPSEYHVLIGLDNERLGDRTPFTVSSNLTCLKGVK